MWAHQYDQMSNQISCIGFPGKSIFRTNGSEAHLFGLEPNYGCCTANFGQGWPKLALASYMRCGNTIINVLPLPTVYETAIDGAGIKITLDTEYPFKNEFKYRVEASSPVKMTLKIRVPSFAENLMVDGRTVSARNYLVFDRTWQGSTDIYVSFEVKPKLVARPGGLKCVSAGSLVFSLPIEFEKIKYEYIKKDVERKFPYCDYEYAGKSDWQFGFCNENFEIQHRDGGKYPFSSENPRVIVKTKLVPVEWGYEDGYDTVAAKTPHSRRQNGKAVEKELYPYGCAKLRMTEMPLVKIKE
jgi:hypothetical protein